MLNDLLEESKMEDANQLAGSSYRNESEEFNLKNDDFNYLSQLRAIDEFKLQLNNFEVLQRDTLMNQIEPSKESP